MATDEDLVELRRQDQVLHGMQRMLQCDRRGLCLLREWMRRYGTAGSGCNCFRIFSEHLNESDVPSEEN